MQHSKNSSRYRRVLLTVKWLPQRSRLWPGDKFRAADVDLVFLQMLTYATSYNMLPAIRDLDVPVVLVNVQKLKALDYDILDIASWLGEGYACGAVGEAVADLWKELKTTCCYHWCC